MNIRQAIEQKKEWNNLKKRINALPEDYQFVYKEIQKYLFKVCIMDEEEVVEIFEGLIELFEQGVKDEKEVLDVTGKDVAMFCDNLIIDKTDYMDIIKKEVEQEFELNPQKWNKK